VENWNEKIREVSEFINTEGFDTGLRGVIEYQITYGQGSVSNRAKVYGSIKEMIRGLAGSPVRRGRSSGFPAEVNVVIDTVYEEVYKGHYNLWESSKILRAVCLKHGKSGGGRYLNGKEYAKGKAEKARLLLRDMYSKKLNKAGELMYREWDGSMENLLGEQEILLELVD